MIDEAGFMVLPVISSCFTAAGYHQETQRLRLDFQSGDVWVYQGVPLLSFCELLASPSRGAFYREHIQNVYPGECVQRSNVTPIRPAPEPGDLLVAAPVYLALLQARKAIQHKAGDLRMVLWEICGREPSSKENSRYRQCMNLLAEAGGEDAPALDAAIRMARLKRV